MRNTARGQGRIAEGGVVSVIRVAAFGALVLLGAGGAGAQDTGRTAGQQGQPKLPFARLAVVLDAAAQARLDDALAANKFAVVSAGIDAGRLMITGTTKGKTKQVVLDGTYKTRSNAQRVFTFDLAYLPAGCVANLAAEGKALQTVVQFCTPSGPKGERGKTGKKGRKGKTGAAGATGPDGAAGDTGAKGAKGKAGPAGADGADGPQGTTQVYSIIGEVPNLPATNDIAGFIGATATIDIKAGDVVTGSISAYGRLASGSGPDTLFTALCYSPVDSSDLFGFTEQVSNQVTDLYTYVGQSALTQIPEPGTYEFGLCYVTTVPSAEVEFDWTSGWFSVAQFQ